MGGFSGKYIACPRCREEGKDSTGNHLSVFKDGKAGWCARYHGLVRLEDNGEGGSYSVNNSGGNGFTRRDSGLDIALVSRLSSRALEDRGISKETCEKFGIKVSVDEQTGEVDAHYYPYFDQDGNVVGYKKRLLPKSFSVIGKIKGLFGQHLCKGGKFIVAVEGECLSGDTEVMTDNGWIALSAYDGEQVLAVCEDGTAKFESPVAYIKKPYDGALLSYSSTQVSFCATPGHRMVVQDRSVKKQFKTLALQECGTSQQTVPKTCLHNGPGIPLSNDQIAFALACSADAYFREMVRGGSVRKKGQFFAKIGVKKQRKQARIENLFSTLGVEYKKYNSKRMPEYVFTLPSFCPGRILPLDWIHQSSIEQKRFIIEELVEWDGNRVPNRNQYEYSSKYLENAEWVQMLSHLCGYSSTIIERSNQYGSWYKVSILKGKTQACFYPKKLTSSVSQDGFVYCVQTSTGRILTRKDRKVMVIGNCDAVAAVEMLKLEGKAFNVVSLPHGANEDGKLDATTLRELEWLSSFEGVAICLDQDQPGQATAKQLAEVLASQTKVKIVKLPHKDAGEMHKRGMHREFLRCLYDAKAYHPEQIVEGADLDLSAFRKNKQPGAELPYPKLQKMTWGLRKGEISLVVSGPGLGKSTFVREICYDLSLKGFKIANIALETPMEDLVNTYVAMDNNIPAYRLMFNQDVLPKEQYEESFNKLYKTNNMNFFQWWGNIASDRLMNKLNYFAKSLQVDFIMLDHVSIAILGEEDERLEIDRLFEKLTKLVVETGVGVIAVMHLRKVPGKSFNRGGEVELEDIRGSAGAAQMSWNVWALERDQQGDRKDVLQIRVLKNRNLGFTGVADQLMFNHETGRLDVLNVEHP